MPAAAACMSAVGQVWRWPWRVDQSSCPGRGEGHRHIEQRVGKVSNATVVGRKNFYGSRSRLGRRPGARILVCSSAHLAAPRAHDPGGQWQDDPQ